MGRNQNRCSKKQREIRRTEQANTFNKGFTMGYNMGYEQGKIDVKEVEKMDEELMIKRISKILNLNENLIKNHLSYQVIIKLLVEAYEDKI